MSSVYQRVALDEYLADFISSRYLILERAADEYIQAENELMIEVTTVADNFVDLALDDGISGEDIDNMIDNDLDADMDEYEVYDSDFDDDDDLSSDIDVMLDLEPEVNELDDYDEE